MGIFEERQRQYRESVAPLVEQFQSWVGCFVWCPFDLGQCSSADCRALLVAGFEGGQSRQIARIDSYGTVSFVGQPQLGLVHVSLLGRLLMLVD